MSQVPIQTYSKNNIEKFFEDITEDYGFKSVNQAKFEAARALIWKKNFNERVKFYVVMLVALGVAIGYFMFNISIINFTNTLN